MRVSSYTLTPPDAQEPMMRECPECRGKGEVRKPLSNDDRGYHIICDSCHGTGEVEDDAPVADRSEADDEAYHRSVEDKIGRGR